MEGHKNSPDGSEDAEYARPNIIIELTGPSAYHRPVSVFPGQHIVGR
jgi:hypothetical protein